MGRGGVHKAFATHDPAADGGFSDSDRPCVSQFFLNDGDRGKCVGKEVEIWSY